MTVNSEFYGECGTVQLGLGVFYQIQKHQLELGVGFNPGGRSEQSLLNVNLNYKFFPNGRVQKFNLYMIVSTSFVLNNVLTFYPSTNYYLFLNAGYGLQIRFPEKNLKKYLSRFFLGTSVTAGIFTNSKNSENPYLNFKSTNFFSEVGFNITFRFNIGYEF